MRTSEPLARDFVRDGFVALEDALSEADLALAEDAVGAWARAQIEAWTGRAPASGDYKAAFYAAWEAAGRPAFRRSPLRNLTRPSFFAFLRSPAMLAVAAQALGTDEISVHGIFNARPMMPGGVATPWHQDAQYWRAHGASDADVARRPRIGTVWLPLQDLDPEIGGLEVASLATTASALYADDYRDAASDIIAVRPHEAAGLRGEVPLIKRGGLIVFTHLNAHRGTPNNSQRIRWNVDVRYETNDGALPFGQTYGFVAQSPSGRHREDSFEQWRERCTANMTPAAGSAS